MTLEISQHRRFIIDGDTAGERVDRFLAGALPGESRSAVQRLIAQGEVTVDGALPKPKARLREGQAVEIHIPPPEPTELVPVPMDLDLIFEDSHLLVVNKPAGLVVHPAPSVHEPTLVHGLLALNASFKGIGGEERPGIVHRLDKGTSGVMVVAKDDVTHRGLVELFRVHDIERHYLALALGSPRDLTGTWTSELGRNPRNRLKMASVPKGGRRAVTHYEVLERYPGASLLRLTLETGRTHQIRVHASEAGAPILGDPTYGRHNRKWPPSAPDIAEAMDAVDHQLLHAAVLGFCHPITGASLRFERPPPADFARVQRGLEALRERERG